MGGVGSTGFRPKIPPSIRFTKITQVGWTICWSYCLSYIVWFRESNHSGVFWGGIRYSLHVFSWERITHRTSPRWTKDLITHIGSTTRRIAKQSIGSITPHTISQKILTQYPLKHSFSQKIPFLLKTSKIPYLNQVNDIFIIFINPLTIFSSSHHHLIRNTCSVYRIPPQNTPRKTHNRNTQTKKTNVHKKYRTFSSFLFL